MNNSGSGNGKLTTEKLGELRTKRTALRTLLKSSSGPTTQMSSIKIAAIYYQLVSAIQKFGDKPDDYKIDVRTDLLIDVRNCIDNGR